MVWAGRCAGLLDEGAHDEPGNETILTERGSSTGAREGWDYEQVPQPVTILHSFLQVTLVFILRGTGG